MPRFPGDGHRLRGYAIFIMISGKEELHAVSLLYTGDTR